MKLRTLFAILFLQSFLVAAGFVGTSRNVDACATAPAQNNPVAIANESAIIIWDEASKTEHFIRRASFTTEAKDFGFLVPTPTQPELGEANDEAFNLLAKITAPKVEKKPRPSAEGCGIGCSMASRPPGSMKSGVEVLDQKRIAGQDVVVLRTTDAGDLTQWLMNHGYEFSSTLREWVQPYVDRKWIITASKIAKEEEPAKDQPIVKDDKPFKDKIPVKGKETAKDPKSVASSAVRMSFKTEKPFFPYSEPAEQRDTKNGAQSRMLRIFFLSAGKVKGKLDDMTQNWPGTLVWANKIETTDREKVLDLAKLSKDSGPASWWLTEFEDKSSPRPGIADVFFSPASDQNPVERPPHIEYVAANLPDGLMTYVLAAYVVVPGVLRAVRRRRSEPLLVISRR